MYQNVFLIIVIYATLIAGQRELHKVCTDKVLIASLRLLLGFILHFKFNSK
jgi:hypothetical protein